MIHNLNIHQEVHHQILSRIRNIHTQVHKNRKKNSNFLRHVHRFLKSLLLIAGIFILTGCEKEVDVDMPEYEEQFAVEGWITIDGPASVVLTRNFEFTEEAGIELYEASFITDAEVTVIDEYGNSEILNLVPLYDPVYDYMAYIYVGQSMLGVPGRNYSLQISVGDEFITAETYLPEAVEIKDIWHEPHPDSKIDSMRIVKCKIEDPVEKNYYRYLYQINGEDGASPELSTLTDTYFNGQDYVKAIDSGLENEEQDIHGGVAGYFYVGDTITVNWINAEVSYYNFWTTVDFSRSTEMSPFMNPVKVPGNVDGALGYWSGLGVSQATIILK